MRARYRTDDEVDDERFDVPSDPRGWTTTLAVTNPDHLESRYREFLHDRIDESRQALEAKLLPAIDDMAEPLEARADGFRADISIAGILEHLLRMVELAGRVVGRALGSPQDRILSIGEAVSDHNKGELAEDFGRIAKVQPEFREGHTERRLRAFARENLDLVRDVDRQPFDDLSDELVQAVREGKRPEALKDVVEERLGVTESRAERIARDQVSKLNSDFNRVRQRENGIERYEWMSAADRRVRTSHAFLHGQIRRWSNPHPTEGHPGDPINCRCVARGIVADVIDGQEAESKAPQFEVPDFRDRRYSYNPHWPTDGKAEYVQNEWVHGSWSEEPTALKQAAARHFGFDEDRVWNPKGHDPDDALVDDMTSVVDHQYEKAQAELDRRGIDSVTLYRGLSSDVEEQGVLSSWTQSKEVAESFDDYIVEEEIPAERVLFFKGGPNWEDGKFGNQEEWVVLPERPGEVAEEASEEALDEPSTSLNTPPFSSSGDDTGGPPGTSTNIASMGTGEVPGGDLDADISPEDLDKPRMVEAANINEVLQDQEAWENHKAWARNLDPARRRQYIDIVEDAQRAAEGLDDEAKRALRRFRQDIEPDDQAIADWVEEHASDVLGDATERELVRRLKQRYDLDVPEETLESLAASVDTSAPSGFETFLESLNLTSSTWRDEIAPDVFEVVERRWNRKLADVYPDSLERSLLQQERRFDGDIEGEFVTTDEVREIVEGERNQLQEGLDAVLDQHRTSPRDIYEDLELAKDFEELSDDQLERLSERAREETREAVESYMTELQRELAGKGSVSMPTDIADDIDAKEDVEQALDEVGVLADESMLPNMSGHDGANTLTFVQDEDRGGYIPTLNRIDVGSDQGKSQYATVFHEMAHAIEEHNRRISEASKRFLLDRADGIIWRLFPDKDRDENEFEYGWTKGLWKKYIGKVYDRGLIRRAIDQGEAIEASLELSEALSATEVMSVGLELFRSPQHMAFLYSESPEHFAFIVAALKGRFGFRAP